MKKFMKYACAALCAVMTVGSLAACGPIKRGGNTPGDDDGPEDPPGSGGSISVHYSAGGFGSETNKLISADYKALTGVTVKWVPSYVTNEIQQLVLNGQEKYDIVMPLLNMYQSQDSKMLEDLTSVYEAIPDGETVAIKDKMNQSLYTYIEARDGKRYQMFGMNSVSAFCYNATTLNAAFGADNWELPRTTTELFKMGDQLKAKKYYTFCASVGINYNWDYMGTVWWAQYDGYDAFQKYWYGQYYDSTSDTWKSGPAISDSTGRKVSLDTMSKMMKKTNGYMHQLADRMSFEEAQRAFLGGGYVDDMKKCAFMVNGDWLENEMSSYLLTHKQDIGMMRAPVVSELINKLATVNSDAKLSEVVKAVDEGKTSVDGVSEADFATVRDARLMGYTATPNYPIGIPSTRSANKKKLAKDFLVYLYSDRAQKIYAKELKGLTMPAGYTPDDTVQTSDFIQSRIDVFGNDMIPIFPINASQMVYRGGLSDLANVGSPDKQLFNGASSTSLLDTCKKKLTNDWSIYEAAVVD